MKYVLIITLIIISISGSSFAKDIKKDKENYIPAIKDLSCDENEQCKSIGIDYQDCGKYAAYQLYSSKNNDEDDLLELSSKIKLAKDKKTECMKSKPLNTQCLRNQCIDLGHDREMLHPIHYAIKENDIELLKDLIKNGADLEAKCGIGSTPLLYASYIKDIDIKIIKLLLDSGAKINYQHSKFTNTSLINAVAYERLDIIELLLKNKADPYLSNFWGSAIDYVEKMQDKPMMELFRKYGYKIY